MKKVAIKSPAVDERKPVDAVFDAMHNGMSLRKACEMVGISKAQVMKMVAADEAVRDHYARARAALVDWHAEELEDIGEQAAIAGSMVEIAGLRLQSDNRKWLLSKLAPKKYGDKLELDASVKLDAAGELRAFLACRKGKITPKSD